MVKIWDVGEHVLRDVDRLPWCGEQDLIGCHLRVTALGIVLRAAVHRVAGIYAAVAC